jgi:SAM-dependent methyltransferase
MIAAVPPVAFLTKFNVKTLKEQEYMVAPKADGQRVLLLCEQSSFDLYLIHPPSKIPTRLNGRYVGPKQKSTGFLIDAEVVKVGMNTSWILAFDILSMEADIELDGKKFKAWLRRDSAPSLQVRHELLTFLVKNLRVQGLFLKSLRPAQEAFQVQSSLDSLPYKTDGLVFTPMRGDVNLPALKWKQPTKLTLDIAVGGPIKRGPMTTSFIAYLDTEVTEGWLEPVTTASRVVLPSHRPFCLSEDDPTLLRFFTEKEGYFAEFECDQNCPCGTMRLSHCLKCSSLGISSPSSPFTCQIACVDESHYHGSHKCFNVDIPNDVADWAQHGIVEVIFEGLTSLKFIRMRRDRQHANSVSVANTILKSTILGPIDISRLHFKSSAEATDNDQTESHYRLSTATGVHPPLSEFANLRAHHCHIKGWLYRAFGGRRIIDACAGGLNDIQNWVDAGFTSVLAIDKDEGQLITARSRLKDFRKANKLSDIQISLVEGDLSKPMDLNGGPFETAFCNFAVHYFCNANETIKCFLNNLASVLDDNGRFVITYLQGDKLVCEQSIKIYNRSGTLEFSADMVEAGLAEVFVASIGIPHRESVMVFDDVLSCFKEAGFRYVASFPFQTFASVLPSGSSLSSMELEMSCLYAAAVFEKWRPCQEQNSFFPIRIPPNLEYEPLSFLDIPDLVNGRQVCKFWKSIIDHHFQVPLQTKIAFFDRYDLHPGPRGYATGRGGRWIKVAPPALAMFLRWGGKLSMKLLTSCCDSIRSEIDDYSDYDDDRDNYYDGVNWGWYGDF